MDKKIEQTQKLTISTDVDELVGWLSSTGDRQTALFERAREVKLNRIGNVVHFRGLIEFSNLCRKNCFYCGIRKDNKQVSRYSLSEEEIVTAARYAFDNGFGSVVLQSGEITSQEFTDFIERVIKKIRQSTSPEIGITLSLGEQSEETYLRWREAGAQRYLLRIETSNPKLYKLLHPDDSLHRFETRLNCLYLLKKLNYQVGTGVMIGLPFQTLEDLANDLIFMYRFDIDMCGMGPYIEHAQTPLYNFNSELMSLQQRFDLSLKMIALLRLLMPDINIAATTALQAIDPIGREKAIRVGANIIMPNITPAKYREHYLLYENKPCIDENADDCLSCLEARIAMIDHRIGKNERGDSLHYQNRNKKNQVYGSYLSGQNQ
ncbi:MAG: [FeFe] hydrogenase H-cluster radical SAM maturase HydE [Bacteroidales bacterium]|nr:[FeFe] hydrogenase H-cluster radical SAM maturase HydE [Bacteroidales bacterium]